jgi:glycosyltransferase involved in cell wall biosynthesis
MANGQKIRVLHVFAEPAHGAWIVAPLACYQAKNGYEVEFACSDGEFLDQLKRLGLPVTVVPISRKLVSASYLDSLYKLIRLMRAKRFHIVHSHTPTASVVARIAAFLTGTPIVIHHMRTSFWEAPGRLRRLFFTAVEFVLGFCTTHIFTINCLDARDVVKYRIKRKENVECLHCGSMGVDTNLFDPSKVQYQDQMNLRQALGISQADFVIGYIGRMIGEKGIIELVEAFVDINRRKPNVKLLLVGGVLASERDQDALLTVQRRAMEAGISDLIIQTGFRKDIPLLISIMDVLVLPSHREGFGMVLAEAAAMECPVISTATRGGREAILHGKNGLLVPINDPAALRDAILSLMENPHLRQQMGKEGRIMALNQFKNELICLRIDDKYSELIHARHLLEPGNHSIRPSSC